MKKYFVVLSMALAAMCFLLSSCSKDDGGIDEASVVGLWTFVNFTADIENPTDKEALEYEKSLISLASVFMQGTTIEFKADKSFILTLMGDVQKGRYASNGGSLTITMNGETAEVNSDDMVASGSTITLKDGVLTITSDSLDADYRSQGFTKYIVRMMFKK